jgi:CubicO group peptidase (beta-lactamase class C family)
LTHTSGLAWPESDTEIPGFYEYYPLDSAPPLREWIPQYVVREGEHYVSNVWKKTVPGEHELYSNIGTGILGYLVEVMSGMDYNEYCKVMIFNPLEMVNTSYRFRDINIDKVARKYDSPSRPIGQYQQLSYPTHSLKSTVEDFSHFIIAIMQEGRYKSARILSKESINTMLTIQNQASGQCLIWRTYLDGWKGHSGGEPGAGSHAEFHQEKKLGMIVFTNRRNKSVRPGGRIHAILRRIVGESDS